MQTKRPQRWTRLPGQPKGSHLRPPQGISSRHGRRCWLPITRFGIIGSLWWSSWWSVDLSSHCASTCGLTIHREYILWLSDGSYLSSVRTLCAPETDGWYEQKLTDISHLRPWTSIYMAPLRWTNRTTILSSASSRFVLARTSIYWNNARTTATSTGSTGIRIGGAELLSAATFEQGLPFAKSEASKLDNCVAPFHSFNYHWPPYFEPATWRLEQLPDQSQRCKAACGTIRRSKYTQGARRSPSLAVARIVCDTYCTWEVHNFWLMAW